MMISIRKILHPTDFSPRSRHGLELACARARDYGAQVTILHVVPHLASVSGDVTSPLDPEAAGRVAYQQLAKLEVPDGDIVVERRLEAGDPATKILEIAREIQADLIVMATHGRTGLGRLLIGSVAEQVVRKAECPVLTTTGAIRAREPSEPKATADVPELAEHLHNRPAWVG